MNTPVNMSRETALRIALAARAMPGVGVGKLLEVLHQRIEGELSEQSLQTITVTDIKIGLGIIDGDEDGEDIGTGLDLPAMKDAVRILWGETLSEDMPVPVQLESMPPDTIRVAVASNNGERLDGHFGSCLRFLVYQVGLDSTVLVDIRSALEAEYAEDKNAYRTELIKDCQVLYIVSIGGPAAAKVVKGGIYPMKTVDGGFARDVIAQLQTVMSNSPPPWLAKLLGVAAEQRVRFALSDEVA
ncbi:dinitrogenase iron-molybdenum cofactor biosynthesis protein [Pseudomonas syringae]|uniref:Dinitrogenase iron-molybdenum cofactor biosynthesis protein n=1 Tax=Pseudomonas syringae TaxID=317 RepID=A0A1C7YXZ7_PSESX|nr:dinitrogenase iron-molybdenum cofactor biosynthesis protein [Pseudomonas syringae]OCR22541.1 dinitrogenase iron-molybdenum cofactor biosynthesis protein [Pseudomonas syringae]